MTLTEFLLARVAEDEAIARATLKSWPWNALDDDDDEPDHRGEIHSPFRWITECEAKRRIVELHASGEEWCGWSYEAVHDGTPCDTLRALALPYAGHPDYRDEWRMS